MELASELLYKMNQKQILKSLDGSLDQVSIFLMVRLNTYRLLITKDRKWYYADSDPKEEIKEHHLKSMLRNDYRNYCEQQGISFNNREALIHIQAVLNTTYMDSWEKEKFKRVSSDSALTC
jgi:hypothetical protein